MKIVRFKDGNYAIRKWSLFGGYAYKDLKSEHDIWWGKDNQYFKDCLTNDLDYIKLKLLGKLKKEKEDYGTPLTTEDEVIEKL